MKKVYLLLILHLISVYCQNTTTMRIPAAKFHNPNYVKDRLKTWLNKPPMPESWKNRYSKKYNPAWMDYCDPYHCNDYHKIACGLNRETMRFKWFQSACHLILNNQCSQYRGFLKFDIVETKYCSKFVMHLRQGCRTSCKDQILDPKCGLNMADGHVVLFKNQCALDAANCRAGVLQEYDPVDMRICEFSVQRELN